VGDFNGDGHIDLAVSNSLSNTVSILLGNGDGTFAPQQTYPAGLSPVSVVVGDFNGDGKLDVVTENNGGVSVLLGNGDGTFGPPQTFDSSADVIAAGDFNGDGKLDLVSSVDVTIQREPANVAILLGNGDGTFADPVFVPMVTIDLFQGSSTSGVVVADFNGDGKPDIAATCYLCNISDADRGLVYVRLNETGSDTTPPVLGMPSWTNNPMTTTQTTTVTVPVSDTQSGVAGGEYYLGTTDPGQGNGNQMTLSGGNLSASFSGLAAGIYTINFRAEDNAGNWSPVTTDYLVVYSASQSSADGHSNKILPVYGTDVLAGLIQANQTDAARFAFTAKYLNGVLSNSSTVHFDYSTGAHCSNPNKPTNCHSTTLDATSIAWMVVSGTNNAQATIQGTATLTIDGTTTTNPFRVIATDGSLLTPASVDQFELEIYAPGADPNSAQPIYFLNEPLGNGNVVVNG
jgi:hypothetical protein